MQFFLASASVKACVWDPACVSRSWMACPIGSFARSPLRPGCYLLILLSAGLVFCLSMIFEASSFTTFVESFKSLLYNSTKSGPFRSRSFTGLTNCTPSFLASVSFSTLYLSLASPNSDLALKACRIGSSNSPVSIYLNPLLSLVSLLSFGSLDGLTAFCSLTTGLTWVGALILDCTDFCSLTSSPPSYYVADIFLNLNTNETRTTRCPNNSVE